MQGIPEGGPVLAGSKTGFSGLAAALGAGVCCLITMALIGVGVGAGAFMAAAGKFSPFLIPAGWLGFGGSLFFFARRWKKCACEGRPLRGGFANLVLLGVALAILSAATYITFWFDGM